MAPVKKVLVTGANGLIGYSIYKECLSRGWNVIGIDNGWRFDITDNTIIRTSLDDFIKINQCDFDIVFHMAAINGTKHFYEIPNTVITNNVSSDINLFNWVDANTRLMYASSSEVVSGNKVPSKEDVDIVIENIHNPRWSYRLGKLLSENFLVNSNLNYIILRYFNVFGERSHNGHFFYDILKKLKNSNLDLPGGLETRSFCYADDAAWATVELSITKDIDIVNICNDEEIIIEDAADIIAEIFKYKKPNWIIQPGLNGSANRRQADITKLTNYLPNFKPMPFKKAVEKIYLTTHV